MQASSLDQLATGLISVFKDGLQQAANQASQQPERFSQIIEQFADIPKQLLDKIRESANKPDWLGLLLFLAVQLRDAVGEPTLKVGVSDPGEGWSRALILIYTQSVQPLVEFRLSIALGGDGTNGIIIEPRGAPDFKIPASLFVFAARGTGVGEWRFPFRGGGLKPPAAGATLGIDLALTQPILPGEGDISLAIGIPKISGSAEVGTDKALNWKVDVSFGSDEEPGLHAKLNLVRFLGDLATVVQLQAIDERYSPTLHLSSNQAPAFDIGHQGG